MFQSLWFQGFLITAVRAISWRYSRFNPFDFRAFWLRCKLCSPMSPSICFNPFDFRAFWLRNPRPGWTHRRVFQSLWFQGFLITKTRLELSVTCKFQSLWFQGFLITQGLAFCAVVLFQSLWFQGFLITTLCADSVTDSTVSIPLISGLFDYLPWFGRWRRVLGFNPFDFRAFWLRGGNRHPRIAGNVSIPLISGLFDYP